MVLEFIAIDNLGQTEEFSWWFTNLSFTSDVLSNLSSRGRTIMHARLIDNEHHIQLPLDAFNGKIMSSSIRQLESERQQLLA